MASAEGLMPLLEGTAVVKGVEEDCKVPAEERVGSREELGTPEPAGLVVGALELLEDAVAADEVDATALALADGVGIEERVPRREALLPEFSLGEERPEMAALALTRGLKELEDVALGEAEAPDDLLAVGVLSGEREVDRECRGEGLGGEDAEEVGVALGEREREADGDVLRVVLALPEALGVGLTLPLGVPSGEEDRVPRPVALRKGLGELLVLACRVRVPPRASEGVARPVEVCTAVSFVL